jgi:hypothetical protein
MTYSVTATYKGERVYLASHTSPRQTLLTLSIEPVIHDDQADAERIVAMAHDDETLTDIRMEVA